MKNKFLNKTVGAMLVASMLCMMVATGCGSDNTTTPNTATEAVTEATTEAEPKEVVTIKSEPDTTGLGFDYGITVEGTNSEYKFLITTSLADSETEYKITDERVKEIFYITMNSKVEKSREVDADTVITDEENQYITTLNETVKVSIPYDEGMYVLASENGVAYDVNAEYIDGNYVFETDTLGEFIISTEPTGRTEPTKTENV